MRYLGDRVSIVQFCFIALSKQIFIAPVCMSYQYIIDVVVLTFYYENCRYKALL